ncbi:hypothetical protein ABZS66_19015 [Dactylosporangium sp. NPDC005572]|uniref:hypothetical protein n=1 Tax=Dactylosporangium sp. NPDC005572 TaxID=3156889 RepID=UPI0033BD11AE
MIPPTVMIPHVEGWITPDQLLLAWRSICVALVLGLIGAAAVALWQAGFRIRVPRPDVLLPRVVAIPRRRSTQRRIVLRVRRARRLTTEIRRHDGTGETYRDSVTKVAVAERQAVVAELSTAQPTRHALDESDAVQRRWRVVNLVDTSCDEIDLATLLAGPREQITTEDLAALAAAATTGAAA